MSERLNRATPITRRWSVWAALALIAAIGGFLRFSGLAWGLRHRPHADETVFVENAARMVAQRTLDHGFYEYPGLFIGALALVFAGVRPPDGSQQVLVARGFVAALGTLSLVLAFLLARRHRGERAGLLAAAFLCVCPLDVWTAHMVRTDVALGAAALLALLSLFAIGRSTKGDASVGVAVGTAVATKVTGVFLVASYLVRRWREPGPRLAGVAVFGVVATAVILITTPYALIHAPRFLEGQRVQAGYQYGQGVPIGVRGNVAYYGARLLTGFGPFGIVAVGIGAWLAARERRFGLALVAYPAVVLAVLATAQSHFDRFLLPITGVIAVLAAWAVDAAWARSGRLGALLSILCAAFPAAASLRYVKEAARPSGWDRALDWTLDHMPEGSRILCDIPALGLDRHRTEVVRATESPEADEWIAGAVDLVVYRTGRAVPPGCGIVFEAPATHDLGGLTVCRPRPTTYEAVPLGARQLSASDNSEALPRILDSSKGAWTSGSSQRPGQWIRVDFAEPTRIGRIEVLVGARPARYARDLHVEVTDDGSTWRRIPVFSARAPMDEQVAAPFGDDLVFPPLETRGIRLVLAARSAKPWSVAELRIARPKG